MTKTMTKTLNNAEVLNILGYINRKETDKNGNEYIPFLKVVDATPMKVKWNFKKNIKKLTSAQETYQEFEKEINEKYSTDELSQEQEMKDENGNTILDEEGNAQKGRVVKTEFIADYQKERIELLKQTTEFKIDCVDIEDFGEADMCYTDMEMLSFMIIDEEDE